MPAQSTASANGRGVPARGVAVMDAAATANGQLQPSSPTAPCPICGRDDRGGDCRIKADGSLVLCHHGATFHPPAGLKPGATWEGKDGQTWAYTRETDDGRAAVFTLDKPRSSSSGNGHSNGRRTPAQTAITLARLPQPGPVPPDHWPNGTLLDYSPTQRIKAMRDDPGDLGEKAFYPQHKGSKGWAPKAGPDPWPLWLESEALQHGPGKWISEAEGEKCAAWICAGGLVAVSQPGHDHTTDKNADRYRRLQEAGIIGIAYLADNDKKGEAKAKVCAAAAAAAGLDFRVIHAADVWPGIPEKGSIDDAQGTAAERCQAFATAAERSIADPDQAPPAAAEPSQRPWAERNHRKLSHRRAMDCFDRCVEVQAARERNSLRRRARLLKAAMDLGISKYVNRQEISQRILEVKDQQGGRAYKSLSAADRAAMERPRVEWLIPGLVPARDMTIIGGRAKVGKTRLAMALAAAFLTGSSIFEQGEPAPGPVIVVSDDQGDGDTADMLEALGIWDHPRLIWSPNFRLTESDLDSLLQDVKAHPGALVILDSLRSISRQLQHGENDPELGVMLYDLKAAVTESGGTPLLIHHCNKAEGLTGVEALSGHNSISGAVNGVVTLHHLIDDKGRPKKDDPQRRMVRQARSGQDLDLVISPVAGTGRFYRVGTFADWQRQQQESEAEQKAVGKLGKDQRRILEVLEDSGQWMTRRQVCDALGIDWGDKGKGAGPKGVWNSLKRLAQLGLAESERAGNEATYRASCSALESESMESMESLSDASGFGDSNRLESMESLSDASGFAPVVPENADGDRGIPEIPSAGIFETDCGDRGIPEIPRIPAADAPMPADPALIDRLIELRRQQPAAHPACLVNRLDPDGRLGVTGRNVKAWLADPAVQARMAAYRLAAAS